MKTGTIFWSSLLISLGATLLALQQHWISLPWDVLHNYWAVLLILWGVALLIRKTNLRWIFVMLTAVTAGFVIASSAYMGTYECRSNNWNIHFNNGWHHHSWSSDCDDDENDDDDDNVNSSGNSNNADTSNSGITKDSLQKKHQDSVKKHTPLY